MIAQDRQQAVASSRRRGACRRTRSLRRWSAIASTMPPRAGRRRRRSRIKLVSATDASSADTEAQKLVFDVDVWDRYALAATCRDPALIMGHVRRILHLQPLAVPGCNLILLRCTASQGPFRDPDDITLHGVVTVPRWPA